MKDGLSQQNRIERMIPIDSFEPMDGRMETLLRQAVEISTFIRYYNQEMCSDGYFDAFLEEVKNWQENQKFDGNMEPSQAILYTFLHNLRGIILKFNQKWKEQYIPWYINQLLAVQSESPKPDFTWIRFQSDGKETICISKKNRFTYDKAMSDEKIYYSLVEDTEVNTIQLNKTYLLYLEKNNAVYPANLLDFPIALHKKNYSLDEVTSLEARRRSNSILSIGLQITSPSFLLESGKRKVTVSFRTEKQTVVSFEQKRKLIYLFRKKKEQNPYLEKSEIREDVYLNLLNSLFYLKISTGNGWENIARYTINFENRQLNIGFLLEENFSPTIACSSELHETTTEYPALKILLNRNAWLYPYAWLKNFYIKKINIRTCVENATNFLLYNDLGPVDISKPFCPFGVNTEKGACFILGNYEMAKKRFLSVDVKMQWQQLPVHTNGLFDYYHDYQENIDNLSFKVQPKYLLDYGWKNTDNTEEIYLFSTMRKEKNGQPESRGKLADESHWQNIRIKGISPVQVKRENYEYTSQTRTGFFRFELKEPDMGLGEKRYRQLYTKLLMSKDFRKKREITLNEPLIPLVNRITMSYEASDEIDLRACTQIQENRIHHIYPLGEQLVYPKQDNRPLSFIYCLKHDFNVLFGFKNVKGDEILNLYFELSPLKKEISLSDIPVIVWYWGDGYHWERLPDDAILRNTTQNLLTNGFLRLYIPPVPETGFRDAEGLVWIMAGVVKNEQFIAPLIRLHNNAALVTKDIKCLNLKRSEEFILNEKEKEIPGITDIFQIVPFNQGQEPETEQQKALRLSEYVTHRQRAVSRRDYERITLQAFPEIAKVKCLYDTSEKKVTLVIIPKYTETLSYECPCATPELLLKVEKYFQMQTSAAVRNIDAIHPIYEEVIVRCEATLTWIRFSCAASRAILTGTINQLIAPWQKNKEVPSLNCSFTLQKMYDKISQLEQVEEIRKLSVIHIYRDKNKKYFYKEYTKLEDSVFPSVPYAILIPGKKHLFVSGQEQYGLEEMNINENFII